MTAIHRRLPSSASFATEFLLPASLLIILIIVPPHVFDLSVARIFFDQGWPWHHNVTFTTFVYRLPKFVPFLIAAPACLVVVRLLSQGRRPLEDDLGRRAIYLITAMAVSAVTVWWLKGTTGVACPWNTVPFGGELPVTNPNFGLKHQPGNCWPSGHAGTGFVLFALYFATRDRWPRVAIASGLFALLFGTFCGMSRVMEGAHFVSHVLVTGLIDWLLCAAIAIPFFPKKAHSLRQRTLTSSGLVSITALWWTLVFNGPFFMRLLGVANTGFVWTSHNLLLLTVLILAFGALSTAIITTLLTLPRLLARSLLILLAVAGGMVFAAECLYGITFNPDMARNILATDLHESSAYLSVRTLFLAAAAMLPPAAATLMTTLPTPSVKRSVLALGTTLIAVAVGATLLMTQMQSLSSLIRGDRTARYLIAPVNVPYSLAATLTKDMSPERSERLIIDPTPSLGTRIKRPAVLLVVIGETTRAANWGLAGYERPTTPELSQEKVISHPNVLACGTSTDVSLPCMMSRIGRSDYDRKRILSEEALPGLLQRAGVNVVWVDNQSGCKGACRGVPTRRPTPNAIDCPDGRCFDGVLVEELKKDLASLPSDRPTVLFYHLYGEHGPRYYEDAPDGMKLWQPECRDADLGICPKPAIVNAYDNAVRYTDHVLARLIRTLKAEDDRIDAGMLFVSDHGESLGENGLFLHGAPYLIAPDVQKRVPMVAWFSQHWGETFGIDTKKLELEPPKGVTHEHLYSTVLSLVDVRSSTYRLAWDLAQRHLLANSAD